MHGELARIVREEADFAIVLARQISSEPVRSVHQCRKAIKRLRAIVRLGRAGSGKDWRAIDRKFRDAGRMLAETRDSHVLPRTATALTDDPASFPGRQDPRDTFVPGQDDVDCVVALLASAGADLEQHIGSGDWSIEMMRRAMEKTRRTTARRMDRFRVSGRPADAHSWRKGVQRYANQVRLMDSFLPEQESGRLDALDALASSLGHFHDLTVFRTALKAGRIRFDKKTRHRLLNKARASQRKLRQSALDAGTELFGDARGGSASSREAHV
ncbi:MAG TPA: CHAD domain-containing protein [Gammaproteobacteria bacterium]